MRRERINKVFVWALLGAASGLFIETAILTGSVMLGIKETLPFPGFGGMVGGLAGMVLGLIVTTDLNASK